MKARTKFSEVNVSIAILGKNVFQTKDTDKSFFIKKVGHTSVLQVNIKYYFAFSRELWEALQLLGGFTYCACEAEERSSGISAEVSNFLHDFPCTEKQTKILLFFLFILYLFFY